MYARTEAGGHTFAMLTCSVGTDGAPDILDALMKTTIMQPAG
jgi:hypothetical protein